METLKYLLLLVFCIPLFGRTQTNSERLYRTKIAYQKPKRLFAKTKYIIFDVPKGCTTWKFETHHGFTAGILYPDSSALYYWDDGYMMTPNKDNYKTVSFEPPQGWAIGDTVLSGQQADGKYWKEKFTNRYWIGYKDVPKEEVKLFDKSLASFKRDK